MWNTPPKTRQWTIRKFPWEVPAVFLFLLAIIFFKEPLGAFKSFLTLFLIIFVLIGQVTLCKIDLDSRTITLDKIKIWGRKRRCLSFDEIYSVQSKAWDGHERIQYQVVCVLHSGEHVPLADASSAEKSTKKRAAAILAYLERDRPLAEK